MEILNPTILILNMNSLNKRFFILDSKNATYKGPPLNIGESVGSKKKGEKDTSCKH